MTSIAEVMAKATPGNLSLRAFANTYNTNSLREAIAEYYLHDFYRRTCGIFGPLGGVKAGGGLTANPDGSFTKEYQFGHINLENLDNG